MRESPTNRLLIWDLNHPKAFFPYEPNWRSGGPMLADTEGVETLQFCFEPTSPKSITHLEQAFEAAEAVLGDDVFFHVAVSLNTRLPTRSIDGLVKELRTCVPYHFGLTVSDVSVRAILHQAIHVGWMLPDQALVSASGIDLWKLIQPRYSIVGHPLPIDQLQIPTDDLAAFDAYVAVVVPTSSHHSVEAIQEQLHRIWEAERAKGLNSLLFGVSLSYQQSLESPMATLFRSPLS